MDENSMSQPPLTQLDGEKEKPPDHPDGVDGKPLISLFSIFY